MREQSLSVTRAPPYIYHLILATISDQHIRTPSIRSHPGDTMPEPIYCATGEEIPLYEPCRDRKDQRDI